jgi:hypothetical protein
MTAARRAGYQLAEHTDHVEVRGVSRRRLEEALELLDRVRAVQSEHAAANRTDLVRTLMSAAHIPLTPPATVAQAQRLAGHRSALLGTPALTHAALRELRGDSRESSTRTWLSRRKDADELFTVSHNGRTLVPAFQLDADAQPRAELQPVLAALAAAGVQGWSLWTWLTSPSSLLSGGVPERLAATAPQRVLRAARRFAANRAA